MSPELPQVIGQHAQPTTSSQPGAFPPGVSSHIVTLTGKLGGVTPKGKLVGPEEHHIPALLGSEGVTPTDGWGKWAEVGRRQRTALTVLEGYAPYTITVPILLDAGYLGFDDIEGQCSILEWFGGRGTLFRGKPGHPGQGEPPVIEVSSESELVPKWCQSGLGPAGSTLYVLQTPIEYNMCGREWITPIRRSASEPGAGRRIRQAATLTLVQYNGAAGNTSDSAANRFNVAQAQGNSFIPFTVSDNINTFTRIAKHFNHTDPGRIPEAARKIQQANTKYGASVYKTLPRGAKIRVPESATQKRF
jgi:hypothetical protein